MKTNHIFMSKAKLNKTALGAILASFDTELVRLTYQNPEHARVVSDIFLTRYITTDIYTFFVLRNLASLSDSIQSSPTLRDFVMNMSERASSDLATLDIDSKIIIDTISATVCRNKVDPERDNQSLLVEQLNDSIYVRSNILEVLLADNFWLCVLWVVLMYFDQTTYFKTQLTELN